MNLSPSQFGKNIWAWTFWGLVLWLFMELGPFSIAALFLKRSIGELAGPYLAFALPWLVLAPSIWMLRKWEDQSISPDRVARGWGLSLLLFFLVIDSALFYSGIILRLIGPMDAAVAFLVSAALGGSILYFGGYHQALAIISSRASRKLSRTFLK